ncbi:ALK and LTK ligand 2a-like [Corythoichthys intestinalis]|uniref:ALK and LTK ligand 2a-like n=1 Tax=Corythoichthys intestinalis TaxID=161448 RepID=UPI0025A599F8|nr:ALK and LTK ligand 2a-like [Corythoichthys intestinalis]XP_057678124.1 ALK and LTK ligand 2a-like [Corythoichthys intestinalis]XP_061806412.1 ALK and LTK ligand 2a-like [Nerophis lumbriciformis]
MKAMRAHATVGVLLMVTCTLVGAGPTPRTSVSRGSRRASELAKRVEELIRDAHTTRRTVTTAEASWSRRTSAWPVTVMTTPHGEQRDLRRSKADRRHRRIGGTPRDPRWKDKYLKHITGPLFFSPKCRRHVYHVYHHTRDCTIPEYFKRCARLLTRLAGSPMCNGA